MCLLAVLLLLIVLGGVLGFLLFGGVDQDEDD